MRSKGSVDKKKRKESANSSRARMQELADSRRLPEEQTTIRVLKSAKEQLFKYVPRHERTMYVTRVLLNSFS